MSGLQVGDRVRLINDDEPKLKRAGVVNGHTGTITLADTVPPDAVQFVEWRPDGRDGFRDGDVFKANRFEKMPTTGPGEAIAAVQQANFEGFSDLVDAENAKMVDQAEKDQITALQDMLNEAEGQLIVARDSLSRQAAVTNWLCESDPELKAKINAFSAGWTRAKRS